MRAALIKAFGEPSQMLDLADVPQPSGPALGEVLIGLQPRHRPLPGTDRHPVGTGAATLADRDVYRDDDDFYAGARADEPDGLQHRQFYNGTVSVVAGTGVALLSFRLFPPLSPAYRMRRLLALTLRDLRRLATGRTYRDWFGHIGGRLVTIPAAATPLQRAQLLAALSVGSEIIQFRDRARRLGLNADLGPVLAAVAQGDSTTATAQLARLAATLATQAETGPEMQTVLRARGSILVISETLARYASYFQARTQR